MTERDVKCPTCGIRRTAIIDSRWNEEALSIRRRRKCANGHRWSTREYFGNTVDATVELRREIAEQRATIQTLCNMLNS